METVFEVIDRIAAKTIDIRYQKGLPAVIELLNVLIARGIAEVTAREVAELVVAIPEVAAIWHGNRNLRATLGDLLGEFGLNLPAKHRNSRKHYQLPATKIELPKLEQKSKPDRLDAVQTENAAVAAIRHLAAAAAEANGQRLAAPSANGRKAERSRRYRAAHPDINKERCSKWRANQKERVDCTRDGDVVDAMAEAE